MFQKAVIGLVAAALLTVLGCAAQPAPAPEEEEPAPAAEEEEPAPAAEEVTPVEMSFGVHYAPNHIISIAWAEFCEDVEVASQGAIQMEFFPAAQLGPSKEYFEMLAKGTLDMAAVPSSHAYGHIPELDLTMIPGLVEGEWLVYNVFQQGLSDLYAPLFETRGVKVLGWHTCGRCGLFTKEEIRDPGQLNGMPVRGAGGAIGAFFDKVGASMISISGGEIYTAAQRGLVEGCRTGVSSYITRGLSEVLPYATWNIPMGNTMMFVAINPELWESLPNHLQHIVHSSATEACLRATEAQTNYVAEEAEAIYGEAGANVYYLTPEELQMFWEMGGAPVLEDYKQDYGELIAQIERIREQVKPFYIP